jgi:DNA-binding protein YbaB
VDNSKEIERLKLAVDCLQQHNEVLTDFVIACLNTIANAIPPTYEQLQSHVTQLDDLRREIKADYPELFEES